MLTDDELKQIENRCSAAQRGPWMVFVESPNQFRIGTHSEAVVRVSKGMLPAEMESSVDVEDEYGYVMPSPGSGRQSQNGSNASIRSQFAGGRP